MSASSQPREHCMTFRVDGHLCGLPIACVREVLDKVDINRVPLAPTSIAGHLNLRGRVVTAISPGALLARTPNPIEGTPSNDNQASSSGQAAIVLEHGTTLYALLIDEMGDVVPFREGEMIALPADRTDGIWATLAQGVLVRAEDLIVVLDHVGLIAALGDCGA